MLRIYDGLIDTLAYLAALLILAIMVGVGLDVASRTLFNQPIGWMFEFVQHSLLAVLFLGSPWLTRQNGHVSIDIIVANLPQPLKSILLAMVLALSSMIAAFIAVWCVITASDNLARGILTTGIYPIPRWILLAIMAAGMALTAIEFARLVYAAARGNLTPHSQTDTATSV
jgi:C4-dicarboxylate transporter DctQ subunit